MKVSCRAFSASGFGDRLPGALPQALHSAPLVLINTLATYIDESNMSLPSLWEGNYITTIISTCVRSALLNWRIGWPNVDIFIRRDIGDSFKRSKPLHIIVFTGASDHSDLIQHFINRETRPG